MPMTLAEINQQEEFDREIYGSNKALFDELVWQTLDMPPGDKRNSNRAKIIEVYNSMVDSCMRQSAMRRRLEHGHGEKA